MRVAIAGSSGLIGTSLVAALRRDRHDVVRLVRRTPAAPDEFEWHPDRAEIDARALDGTDAVINLCGVPLGAQRWTGEFKQELRDSRIVPTEVLSDAVARHKIGTLISASAVGFYGDTGTRTVDESSLPGSSFLARLCQDWEAASSSAVSAGARVVWCRSASILTAHEGVLGVLQLPFSLGLGGRIGSGRQYFPWISLQDEVAAIRFILRTPALSGPVNIVGPAPVTNAQFTTALARTLHRPSALMIPKAALQLAYGEVVKEIVHGARVIPAKLEAAGFEFTHNTVVEALEAALG